MKLDRRRFLSATAAAGGVLASCAEEHSGGGEARFRISLAQWSLHRMLRAGELDNLDFPAFARERFGLEAVEWVNQFLAAEVGDPPLRPRETSYLEEMKRRCEDAGVAGLLIMCDRAGDLGDPDAARRAAAVEGHRPWLEAAALLGCHSIRVNAASDPSLSPEGQADLCVDGLRRLCEQAAPLGLNVLVENHGGLSSNGAWLAEVIRSVNRENCGTLPDFGNFHVVRHRGDDERYERERAPFLGDPAYTEDETGLHYDRYLGVEELMPWARGVSAKSHDFDEEGNEVHTDYPRMMRIVRDSGYSGHIGIEYEGRELGEAEGIEMTRRLLERVFSEL